MMFVDMLFCAASPVIQIADMKVEKQVVPVRVDAQLNNSRGDRASCYRGRLLQGHFMQNYYIDGEIADSSFILIHNGNH